MLSRLLKQLFVTTLAFSLVAGLAGGAQAQSNKVAPGSLDLAGVVGAGETGEAGFSAGLRLERGWRPMGSGTLGLQLSSDFYWWSYGLGYKWFILPIGLSVNYHLNTSSTRLDPFIGLGVGYEIANCSWPPGVWGTCDGAESEVFPIAKVGMRYYMTNVTALYIDAGLGSSIVSAGLSFKLRGGSN